MDINEKVVREAYRLGEGKSLDGAGFRALFTDAGVLNNMADLSALRGEQISQVITGFATWFPDVHRELLEVNVSGDVITVELRIQGTHLGAFHTPAGEIAPTGNQIDVPAVDTWIVRDGKIERFNCYVLMNHLFGQIGVLPDFAPAVKAAAAA